MNILIIILSVFVIGITSTICIIHFTKKKRNEKYDKDKKISDRKCIIQISNSQKFHLEILESVILRYPLLLGHNPSKKNGCIIYLDLAKNTDPQFVEYIKEKYPTLIFGKTKNYNFFIEATLYPKNYKSISHLDPNIHFYISHTYTPTYIPQNVRYLAPFAGDHMTFPATVLPFQKQHLPTYPPIFVVQGSMERRRIDLLHNILRAPSKYPYQILILCRKLIDPTLLKYKQVFVKENLGFVDYHKEMIPASGILTLISKETHSHYYDSKCTSTINYARGYQLLCILDQDLQNIHQLKKSVVYTKPSEIVDAFQHGLEMIISKNFKGDIRDLCKCTYETPKSRCSRNP